MKILLMAPHPFFQERGTPIDVLLVLRVLAERKNTSVDLLVYNEGSSIDLPNLKIFRIPDFKFLRKIRPGFSFKKLICDFLLFIQAWKLVKKNEYDLIHAGEESVFIAMLFKSLYKIPYVYDLDSSIAQQLVERKPYLKLFTPLFGWLETMAIRGSVANLPVCNALADICTRKGSKKTVTIHDISQLKNPGAAGKGFLKKELNISNCLLLYVGNLEPYQGIDLLLESFKIALEKTGRIDLVIIGGVDEDIQFYKQKARNLNIDKKTHFIGPKPFNKLDEYLAEADIIACPRIRGVNTPMKIFPYMHSGRAVIATDLYTHSQILTGNEAYLAPPDPQGFAEGIIRLTEDENLRSRLAKNGQSFVEKNHTYPAHRQRLNEVYDWIEANHI